MHYRDNIEYRDILTHNNRHQLFLISPIPNRHLQYVLAMSFLCQPHYAQRDTPFPLQCIQMPW